MIGCESRNRLSWLNEPPRIMPERACIVPAKRMQIKPTARAFKKLLAWMLVLIASTSSFAADPEVDQPNILLIVADDLGFSDLGCFGGEIQTPILDQLASGGLRLTQFYTTGRCCPSRASLLSGQYPHAVGLGHMTKDIGRPGYRGRIAGDAQTIATRLGGLGYRSFLSGKWHLGTDDPTQHGFEEFYGTLVSAKTFWDRNHFLRLPADRQRRKYTKNEFYGTDALGDHALEFLSRARETPTKPWFLYLAFNAPHFPLQAPPETIAKYAERYHEGWDVLRTERLARMKALGIIPPETALTPRSKHYDWGESNGVDNPAWGSLAKDRRADLARRMAIYAAMVDRMDQNVGRVLNDLRQRNDLENTLVMFTSDNGACAEWDSFGFDIKSGVDNILHRGKDIERMGSQGTFHSVGSGWANASNAPWRLYKHFNHEGGIAVPCIVHWPGQVSRTGSIDSTPTHLIDVLPTLLDVASDSEASHGKLPGESLLPLLRSESLPRRTLFFEHEGNRAVRDGRWKLVALRDQPWELYDIQADRTEHNDLADANPDVVDRHAAAWVAWAKDNHVTPLPDNYGVQYLPDSSSVNSR